MQNDILSIPIDGPCNELYSTVAHYIRATFKTYKKKLLIMLDLNYNLL